MALSVGRREVERAVGFDHGDGYDIFTGFLGEHGGKLTDLVSATATVVERCASHSMSGTASRVVSACDFRSGAANIPQAILDVGSLAEKGSRLVEAFSPDSAGAETVLSERVAAVQQFIGTAADATFTGLAMTKFFHQAGVISSQAASSRSLAISMEAMNIVSSVSGVVDNARAIMEASKLEEVMDTPYVQKTCSLRKQINGWSLAKNIASGLGSVLGIAGIITGIVFSSWIMLGVALIVFVGALVAFCVQDHLERFEKAHVVDRIMLHLDGIK